MSTVTYGQTTSGGKVHRAGGGTLKAFCLSGKGARDIVRVSVSTEWETDADFTVNIANEAKLLTAKGIKASDLCLKCCSPVTVAAVNAAAINRQQVNA